MNDSFKRIFHCQNEEETLQWEHRTYLLLSGFWWIAALCVGKLHCFVENMPLSEREPKIEPKSRMERFWDSRRHDIIWGSFKKQVLNKWFVPVCTDLNHKAGDHQSCSVKANSRLTNQRQKSVCYSASLIWHMIRQMFSRQKPIICQGNTMIWEKLCLLTGVCRHIVS